MGIADEIERIAAEFVPVCVLMDALMKQEGVTPYQLSLWLQRNQDAIERLPVLDFSYGEKNFVWRENLRDAVGDYGLFVYQVEGDFDYSLFASYDYDGFVPGWRASDLRGFFSKTSVKYPEQEVDELLKAEHWRIAIEANMEERQAERERRQALTPPQQAPQQSTAAPPVESGKPHPRRETTYLNIIGALVELIQTHRPGRGSEAAVIREILDNYGERPGISKRTLEDIFPEARKRLQSV